MINKSVNASVGVSERRIASKQKVELKDKNNPTPSFMHVKPDWVCFSGNPKSQKSNVLPKEAKKHFITAGVASGITACLGFGSMLFPPLIVAAGVFAIAAVVLFALGIKSKNDYADSNKPNGAIKKLNTKNSGDVISPHGVSSKGGNLGEKDKFIELITLLDSQNSGLGNNMDKLKVKAFLRDLDRAEKFNDLPEPSQFTLIATIQNFLQHPDHEVSECGKQMAKRLGLTEEGIKELQKK